MVSQCHFDVHQQCNNARGWGGENVECFFENIFLTCFSQGALEFVQASRVFRLLELSF